MGFGKRQLYCVFYYTTKQEIRIVDHWITRDDGVTLWSWTFRTFHPWGGDTIMQSTFSLRVVKGNQKGHSKGSGKPLLCILSYEKKSARRQGESKIFPNLNSLAFSASPWVEYKSDKYFVRLLTPHPRPYQTRNYILRLWKFPTA